MHDVWIDGNMQKVYIYCEFSKAEMVQFVRNAVDMCWAEDDVKNAIYKELDDVDVLE
jgi:adenosine deaminase